MADSTTNSKSSSFAVTRFKTRPALLELRVLEAAVVRLPEEKIDVRLDQDRYDSANFFGGPVVNKTDV